MSLKSSLIKKNFNILYVIIKTFFTYKSKSDPDSFSLSQHPSLSLYLAHPFSRHSSSIFFSILPLFSLPLLFPHISLVVFSLSFSMSFPFSLSPFSLFLFISIYPSLFLSFYLLLSFSVSLALFPPNYLFSYKSPSIYLYLSLYLSSNFISRLDFSKKIFKLISIIINVIKKNSIVSHEAKKYRLVSQECVKKTKNKKYEC